MNHILRLQQDLLQARAVLAAKDEAVQEFLVHLAGPKFRSPASDGSRTDWIAVADVIRWLGRIQGGRTMNLIEPLAAGARARPSFEFGVDPIVVAHGAGVDSTAMLMGLRDRRVRLDLILFADTGSEKPETTAYLPVIQA